MTHALDSAPGGGATRSSAAGAYAKRLGGYLLLAGLLSQLGCSTRPAEDRALRDQEVGRADAHGLYVKVDAGLAVVRHIREDNGVGEVLLWASAPSLKLKLTRSGGPTRWQLTFSNVTRDSELSLTAGQATITAEPGLRPTQQIYTVELASDEVELELGGPGASAEGPFEFGLLSDVQEAIDGVQDIFSRVNREPIAFLLGAGDLTQQGTHEQLTRFQKELESLNVPYYTTLGNHELGQNPTLWHDYFGRGSFNFRYRGVAFTLLDSGSATLDPIVYGWLESWLAANKRDVHIVAMHIPPLDPTGVRNGAFASRNEAAKLMVRLAEGNVDLTLYGHIHSFYDFENGGIPAYISGGGGAIPERFDDIGRHFLVFDVEPKGVRGVRIVRVD